MASSSRITLKADQIFFHPWNSRGRTSLWGSHQSSLQCPGQDRYEKSKYEKKKKSTTLWNEIWWPPPKPLNPLHQWGARNSMNNEIIQMNAANNEISGYLFIYGTKCLIFWVRRAERTCKCSTTRQTHKSSQWADSHQVQVWRDALEKNRVCFFDAWQIPTVSIAAGRIIQTGSQWCENLVNPSDFFLLDNIQYNAGCFFF